MNISVLNKRLSSPSEKKRSPLARCVFLSLLLIICYSSLFENPAVLRVLPKGSLGRRQVDMIFFTTSSGFAFFLLYSSSLFLKKRSRDLGVLLALGCRKVTIRRLIFTDMLKVLIYNCIKGIIISLPVSFVLWNILALFSRGGFYLPSQIGLSGIFAGLTFTVAYAVLLLLHCIIFTNRQNILHVMYLSRKTEIPCGVKSWWGICGFMLTVLGLLLGYIVPEITARNFNFLMPSLWSSTYLISIPGLYMFISYCIIHNKRGINVKKYYNALLPKSTMKLQGKDIIRTMCSSTLLYAAALFSLLYVSAPITQMVHSIKNNPVDFTFFYPSDENQVSEDFICALAEENNLNINSYSTLKGLTLVQSGYKVKWNSSSSFTRVPVDRYQSGIFINESSFEALSRMHVTLEPGQYKKIVSENYSDSIYYRADDMYSISDFHGETSIPLSFSGMLEWTPLSKNSLDCYVLHDSDYASMEKTSSEKYNMTFVFFNVDDIESAAPFAKKLRDKIINRTSSKNAVYKYYDPFKEMEYKKAGKEYYYSTTLDLTGDSIEALNSWKYAPDFKPLKLKELLLQGAVYFTVFLFISLMCSLALIIMLYTRSISLAHNCKNFFDDLKKLGAGDTIIDKCIASQLIKIFLIPAFLGTSLVITFFSLIFYFNSSSLTSVELMTLATALIISALVILLMFLFYRITFRKYSEVIN